MFRQTVATIMLVVAFGPAARADDPTGGSVDSRPQPRARLVSRPIQIAGEFQVSDPPVIQMAPEFRLNAPRDESGDDPRQTEQRPELLPQIPLPTMLERLPQVTPEVPDTFQPWWQGSVNQSLRTDGRQRRVDLNTLLLESLRYSPRVHAVNDNVLIEETAILEAEAEFDPHAFVESKFIRTSDPVGNALQTGGPPRLREADWSFSAGLRRKTLLGGTVEASQQIGLRDSNSLFFAPPNQGLSRLTLGFSQPLLNGAGRAYNTSLVVLAEIETSIADDRSSSDIQDHLLQVTRTYWQMYLQRAALVQRQRHEARAREILDRLENRQTVDSMLSQIARARSAVETRRAELIRAANEVRNDEARLRTLVNAPELRADLGLEMVPDDQPVRTFIEINPQDALVTALEHRPEIDEAMQRIRAAGVRFDMSTNELLPALNLVVETYVSGLDKELGIGDALIDQFSVGEPSYSAGLLFEVPLGRREALARRDRRRLELRQLSSQFESTVLDLTAEVQIAVREVNTAFREMQARYRAMTAAEADAEYLDQRWKLLPGDDRAASFLLEDLLDAQDRLAIEEFAFAQVMVTYTLSLVELKRVTGTLISLNATR